MTKNFFNNINSCSENVWSGLPQNFAAQDVRLRYGNILKVPGKPSANIVIFTTSIQIPVPMEVLFDFFVMNVQGIGYVKLIYIRV